MSSRTSFIAKLLILPVLAGSFCFGMLVAVPMAQATMPEHAFTMAMDVDEVHTVAPDAMGADCCAVAHADHQTDAVTPDAGKSPVNAFVGICAPMTAHPQASPTNVVLSSLQNERVREALSLTGIIIKRE